MSPLIIRIILLITFLLYVRYKNKKYRALQSLINTDYLTGLYNSRYYGLTLKKCIGELIDNSQKFSLISIDIDCFKHINDNFGHTEGDAVLRQVALIMKEFSIDNPVCRVGGDEFMIVLPRYSQLTSEYIAKQIRLAVEKHKFKTVSGDTINVTVSIGVMTYTDNTLSELEIRQKVDQALYAAKECGKNTVCSIRTKEK